MVCKRLCAAVLGFLMDSQAALRENSLHVWLSALVGWTLQWHCFSGEAVWWQWLIVQMNSCFSDYDLSKLRDFIDQQADAYVDKGILDKEEADVIKRIYGSL